VRHLSALLYRIARNRVIDFYRQRASRGEVESLAPNDEILADTRDQFGKLDAKLDVEALAPALRSLKDEYREVLVMKYIDELDNDEIAEAIGKTQGNVRVLLHRAMNALRGLATDYEEEADRTTEAAPADSGGRKP
jgi:RNA polymerase sigma-70 factor (ECF subfamily)